VSAHVLVVGGGMELPGLLRSAGGARTTVMCQLPIVPKLRDPAANAAVIGLPPDAPMVTWLDLATSLHACDPFTHIASFAERDQDRAAAIGEHLGLAMHSTRTVGWVHHKPSMRARLAETGVDDTPYALVGSVAELREFLDRHGYPAVLKPAVGAGSIGISRLTGADDLATALRNAAAESAWTRGGAMVERLHEGPQYSVEAFSENGEHEVVCVTRKYSSVRGHVEIGHVLPAPLSTQDRDAAARYVGRVLDALEISFGPTHTEIVLTADGPRLIETHTRLGGDRLPYLVHDALGVDLVTLTVRQTLGATGLLDEIRTVLTDTPRRYAAIWYAGSAVGGILAGVSVPTPAAEEVDEVVVEVGPGDRVTPLDSSDSRLGYARAHGRTADEALRAARAAVTALEFTVHLDTDIQITEHRPQ
jgi:biotin carboxylase